MAPRRHEAAKSSKGPAGPGPRSPWCLCALVAGVFLLAGQAWGADGNIYCDCTAGLNGDGTDGSPYNNLADTMDDIDGSDTIWITGPCTITVGDTINSNNNTIRGVSTNPDDTVITGRAGRWLYITGTDNAVQYLTLQNQTTAHQMICFAGDNFTCEYCKFRDNLQHIYCVDAAGTIRYCEFAGIAASNESIYARNDSGGDDLQFYSNIIRPSENYLSERIRFRSADGDTGGIYNNIIIGSKQVGVYLQLEGSDPDYILKNNIIAASGADDGSGWQPNDRAIESTSSDSFADYNLTLSLREAYHVDPDLLGDDGGDDNPNGRNMLPGIIATPRTGFIAIEIDDGIAYEEGVASDVTTSELLTLLSAYGWSATWNIQASYLVAEGAALDAAVKNWIDAGCEMGSHGYSASNLTSTDAIALYKNGENTTATVAVTRPDADVPANWTGSITLAGDTNAVFNFDADPTDGNSDSSFADFTTWIEGQIADIIVTLPSEVTSASLLVTLTNTDTDDISANDDDLDVDTAHFQEVELGYGKTILEAQVNAIDGVSGYTCTHIAASYTDINDGAMDEAAEAGFQSMTGSHSALTDPMSVYSLDESIKLQIFAVQRVLSSLLEGDSSDDKIPGECADGVVCRERVDGIASYLAINGGVLSLMLHRSSFTEAELSSIFSWLNAWGDNLYMGSADYVFDYIIANGTCYDLNDSSSCDGATVGSDETWFLYGPNETTADRFDGRLTPQSPCIGAGVYVPGVDEDARGRHIKPSKVDIGAYQSIQQTFLLDGEIPVTSHKP